MHNERLIGISRNEITITGTINKVYTVHKIDKYNKMYKRDIEIIVCKKFKTEIIKYLFLVEVYNEAALENAFREGDRIKINSGELGFITKSEPLAVEEYFKNIVEDYKEIFGVYPVIENNDQKKYKQIDFRRLLDTGFLENMMHNADVDENNQKLKHDKEKKLYSYTMNEQQEVVVNFKYVRHRVCTEAKNIEKIPPLLEGEEDELFVHLRGIVTKKMTPKKTYDDKIETLLSLSNLTNRFNNRAIFHQIKVRDLPHKKFSQTIKEYDVISVKGRLRFYNLFNQNKDHVKYFNITIDAYQIGK